MEKCNCLLFQLMGGLVRLNDPFLIIETFRTGLNSIFPKTHFLLSDKPLPGGVSFRLSSSVEDYGYLVSPDLKKEEVISVIRDSIVWVTELLEKARTVDYTRLKSKTQNLLHEQIAEEDKGNERFLLTLINNLRGIVYRCLNDTNWTMLFLSDAIEPITGYEKEELIGNKTITFNDIIHPDDRDYVNTEIQKALSGNRQYKLEYRIVTKDGKIKWVDEQGVGILGEKGEVRFLEGYIKDITGIKNAEFELKEKINLQKQLTSLAEVAPSGLCTIMKKQNGIFCVKYANPSWETIHGIKFEDVKDNSSEVIKNIHADDIEKVLQCFNESAKNMARWHGEFRYNHPEKKLLWLEADFIPVQDDSGNLLWHGSIADITEKKKREEKLLLTQFGMNNAQISVYQIGAKGEILHANEYACKKLGYSLDELTSMTVFDISPSYTHEQFKLNSLNLFSEGSISFISSHIKKDGTIFPVEITVSFFETNGTKHAFSFAKDVSDRVEAEEKLKQEKEQLDNIITATNVGTWSWNIRKKEAIINEYASQMLGYTKSELEPVTLKTWFNLLHPDDKAFTKQLLTKHLAGETEYFEAEFRMKHKSGDWVWVLIRGKVTERDEAGKPLYMFGTQTDINSRKQSEIALAKSEEKYRNIYEESFDGLFITSPEGKILDMNKKGIAMFGYDSIEEIHNLILTADVYANPDDRQRILSAVNSEGSAEYDVDVKKKDGKIMTTHCSLVAAKNNSEEIVSYRGIIRDITQQKQAEAALKESEYRFRTIFEDNLAIMMLIDPVSQQIVDVNKAAEKFYGWSRDEFCRMKIGKINTLPNALLTEKIESAKSNKKNYFRFQHRRADQSIRDVEVYSSTILISGKEYLHSIIHDITEQIKVENELKNRELLIQEIGRIAKIGGWEFDPVTGEGTWTDEVARIHDLEPGDKTNMQTGVSFYHGESRTLITNAITESIKTGKPYNLELEMVTAKGNHKWVKTICNPVIENGKIVKMRGSFQDITDSKMIEKELRESEERFRALHNASFGGIVIHDKGLILACNQGLCDITGYSMEELIGMNGLLLIAERYRPMIMEKINSGYEKPYEAVGIRKNGQEFPLRVEARNIPYKGKIVRTTEFRDITEQKKAEEELQEREVQYRNLANSGMALIWTSGTDKLCNFFNEPWLKFTGRTFEQETGNGWTEGVHPDDLQDCIATYASAFDKRESFYMEYRLRNSSGEYKWISDLGTPNFNSKNEFTGYIGHCFDITKQKQDAEAVKESEKRFRLISSIASDYMFTSAVNPDGSIVTQWVTGAFENITGYTFDEYKKCGGWRATIHPDDLTIDTKDAETLLSNKNVISELRTVKKNGETVWVQIYAHPVWDNTQNRVTEIYGAVQNITQRKTAELELKTANSILQAVLDASSDAITLTNANGDFKACNQVLLKRWKKSREEFIGTNAKEYLPANIFAKRISYIRSCIGTGKGVTFTDSYDGKWFENTLQPIFENDGSVENVAFFSRDITILYESLKQLRESEKKLAEAQRLAHLGNWYWDIKTGDVEWSEEVYSIFGLDKNNFTPHIDSILALSPWPEDHDRDKELIGYAIKTHEQGSYEQKFLRPDNSIGYYYSTFKGEYNQDGELTAIIGTVQDISERKNAEIILRQSEEKFAKAFRSSPNLILISLFSDGKIKEANNSFHKLFGYSPKDYLEKTSISIGLWKNPADRRKYITLLEKYGKVENMEADFRTQSGEVRQCYISGEVIELNGEKSIISAIHDYTELKHSQEELEKERRMLRTLIETIPDLIWLKDPEGIYLACNSVFEKFIGLSAKEIIGRSDYDFFPKELADSFRQYDIKAIEKNGPSINSEELTFAGNSYKGLFETIKSPMYDSEGKLIGVMGISRDITELNELNQNLEKKVEDRTAQLEAANRGLEAFAYSVSHDLRAPLRHIDGFSKLMKNSLPSISGETERYFKKINDSSAKMSSMIDDLLKFSRLGRKTLQKTEIDLNSLIRHIINQYIPETEGRKIEWRIGILPVIEGDYNLLMLAFENLISNALKFTSKNEQAIIEIGHCKKCPEKNTVFIKDNGVGFDMAYSDKLFNVFQRLHTQEEFAGTGIGLANVKQIIAKHGGSIRAEGIPGQGATFFVTL